MSIEKSEKIRKIYKKIENYNLQMKKSKINRARKNLMIKRGKVCYTERYKKCNESLVGIVGIYKVEWRR